MFDSPWVWPFASHKHWRAHTHTHRLTFVMESPCLFPSSSWSRCDTSKTFTRPPCVLQCGGSWNTTGPEIITFPWSSFLCFFFSAKTWCIAEKGLLINCWKIAPGGVCTFAVFQLNLKVFSRNYYSWQLPAYSWVFAYNCFWELFPVSLRTSTYSSTF